MASVYIVVSLNIAIIYRYYILMTYLWNYLFSNSVTP